MTKLLWTAFFDHDLVTFCHILEAACSTSARHTPTQTPVALNNSSHGGKNNRIGLGSSPGAISPLFQSKSRKASGKGPAIDLGHLPTLTKADLNRKDPDGLTLLHHIASTTDRDVMPFARAMLGCAALDLYVQDAENGWTALHRAFYSGNIIIALAILDRDAEMSTDRVLASNKTPLSLIKIKDRDHLGPLDLYADIIRDSTNARSWPENAKAPPDTDDHHPRFDLSEDMDADVQYAVLSQTAIAPLNLKGDTCFTFGSNRNATLGFGDEDDRQRPERIQIKRPDHLIQRFYQEYLSGRTSTDGEAVDDGDLAAHAIPWVIRSTPIVIQDVRMAKLHTAILTTDPEANLYMCGHGQGGRLGLGHLQTQFQLTCVEGGALAGIKVATVALGRDHTLAVSALGDVYSWGTNTHGQLGYALPKTTSADELPMQLLPRQIFGIFKREVIDGVAASGVHSVAFNSSSLYTWGKNEGQLGIMDSDSRSLATQATPRRVAPSLLTSPIASVCATERATICCLASSECWVFANFGYTMLQCPLNSISNYYLSPSGSASSEMIRRFQTVATGGDTICAVTKTGSIYSWAISRASSNAMSSASTTGPAKIRGALTPGRCIWSPRLRSMDAIDIGVDTDGSVIITTFGAGVWKRTHKAKAQNDHTTPNKRAKDYEITRISGLTRVQAVRASSHGSYAAIRRDYDITRTSIKTDPSPLWADLLPLLWLSRLVPHMSDVGLQEPSALEQLGQLTMYLARSSQNVEKDMIALQNNSDWSLGYDALLRIQDSKAVIPIHRAVLTGRSPTLRDVFHMLTTGRAPSFAGPFSAHIDGTGCFVVDLGRADPLTMVNIALYCYTDKLEELSQFTSNFIAGQALRSRQLRSELLKIAATLGMTHLESSVRQMEEPASMMSADYALACHDPKFYAASAAVVRLADGTLPVHRDLVCVRCPFFQALFNGADGYWIDDRDKTCAVTVDLGHVSTATFRLVLRYLYSDAGCELFDEITVQNEEEFIHVILDVMDVADELMLDKLSQICQWTLGKRVDLRNVCSLTAAVATSRVSRFKEAALSYMALNLEALIHTRTLPQLGESLLLDLQQAVRDRMDLRLPYVRGSDNFWQKDLLEGDRELAHLVQQNRKAKIAALDRNSRRVYAERRGSATHTSDDFDDRSSQSPSLARPRAIADKARRGPSLTPEVTHLGSKQLASSFEQVSIGSPAFTPTERSEPERLYVQTNVASTRTPTGHGMGSPMPTATNTRILAQPINTDAVHYQEDASLKPWDVSSSTLPPGPKFGLKDIMAQASVSRVSNIALGIATGKPATTATSPGTSAQRSGKVSQKERKRLQQQASQVAPSSSIVASAADSTGGSPWQKTPMLQVASLDKIMSHQDTTTPTSMVSEMSGTANPRPLTMRQTIAHQKPTTLSPPASKPVNIVGAKIDTTARTPQRSARSAGMPSTVTTPSNTRPAASPIPRSIQHSPRAVEPALQLSIADIAAQQQLEKDIIRDVGAKRSLQEIQDEQAFQLWWDREAQKYQGSETTAEGTAGNAANGKARSFRKNNNGKSSREGGKSNAGAKKPRGERSGQPGQGNTASRSAKVVAT